MEAEKLIEAVGSISGASFIGIDTVTMLDLKGGKKNPMAGRVYKVVMGSTVMAFQNKNVNGYEEMVRRRLKAEGKDADQFSLGQRVWGTRMQGLPIVLHEKDGTVNTYLEVIFLTQGEVKYYLDDPSHEIQKSKIIGFPESKSDEKGQGGLSDKVIIRTYSAESIARLRIDGKVFQ